VYFHVLLIFVNFWHAIGCQLNNASDIPTLFQVRHSLLCSLTAPPSKH